jgi:hypothetical protein
MWICICAGALVIAGLCASSDAPFLAYVLAESPMVMYAWIAWQFGKAI